MSLRAKLVWAFLLVALVALIPAFLILNLGTSASFGMGMGMHGQMMQEMQNGVRPEDLMPPRIMMAMVRVWSIRSILLAAVVSLGAGIWVAGRITRSVRTLREAAGEIDLRDLSRRVPVLGKDEIADLAATFNRMCDRLEAGERSRRQLLADVAHELRHPLAVMQGRLDLMQDGKVELDPTELLPLQDEVIRLTRLVGDLRDLSLAEVGGLSLNLSPVDMRALLESLQVNLEPVAAGREITLAMELPATLPAVMGDSDRLRQVFVNLVSNALQYTPAGGKVTITAEAGSGRLQIRVADTGLGISPEDLPHIFDRFYRTDKSRSRATGGSGLGLAIVRSLVELHKGRIGVTSKPGEGSCFTVTLPLPEMG